MIKIIHLKEVDLGYCDQCGRPNIVGKLEIFQWEHSFRVCANCLTLLSNEISLEGLKVTEKFFKKGSENAP